MAFYQANNNDRPKMVDDIRSTLPPMLSPRSIESITQGTPKETLAPGALLTQAGVVIRTSIGEIFPNNIDLAVKILLQPEIQNKDLFNRSKFRSQTNAVKSKTKKLAEKNPEFSDIASFFDEVTENNEIFDGYFNSNLQS